MKRETMFIDVGGHLGETLDEVVKPLHLFDRIICFEPQAELAEYLRDNFASERVRTIPAPSARRQARRSSSRRPLRRRILTHAENNYQN